MRNGPTARENECALSSLAFPCVRTRIVLLESGVLVVISRINRPFRRPRGVSRYFRLLVHDRLHSSDHCVTEELGRNSQNVWNITPAQRHITLMMWESEKNKYPILQMDGLWQSGGQSRPHPAPPRTAALFYLIGGFSLQRAMESNQRSCCRLRGKQVPLST